MGAVEQERFGRILVVRLNRPSKLNAMNRDMRDSLADVWARFQADNELSVAVLTGAGRAFCVGEDLVESAQIGVPEHGILDADDPFGMRSGGKPVIAAINGYAMGGGFLLAENADLRIAVPEAELEVSEAKRWLLGGYAHGRFANLPHPVATEMALGYRFSAQRLYDLGFINRLAPADELFAQALAMAKHLLALPPASLVNTVHMMRRVRPSTVQWELELAGRLRGNGAQSDVAESRAAFAEKRPPRFKGWDDPQDRFSLPEPLEESAAPSVPRS